MLSLCCIWSWNQARYQLATTGCAGATRATGEQSRRHHGNTRVPRRGAAFYCDARHWPTARPAILSPVIVGLGVRPMRRREFITIVGSAATAWPFAARAQQRERMRRVGVILPAAADDAEFQAWVGAFLQGLAQSGWVIGRKRARRDALGRRQSRRHSQIRGGVSRARARRHPGTRCHDCSWPAPYRSCFRSPPIRSAPV